MVRLDFLITSGYVSSTLFFCGCCTHRWQRLVRTVWRANNSPNLRWSLQVEIFISIFSAPPVCHTIIIYHHHYHYHHYHVHEGLGVFLVRWSSKWNWSLHLFLGRTMFLRPFGLYCRACFGILFVRVVATFPGTVLFPLLYSVLPFFFIIHWFLPLSSFVIPSKYYCINSPNTTWHSSCLFLCDMFRSRLLLHIYNSCHWLFPVQHLLLIVLFDRMV